MLPSRSSLVSRVAAVALASIACLALASAPSLAAVRVLVLDLRNDGVPDATARLVRDTVTAELGNQPGFEVLSTEDLRRSAALEAEKQAAGCDDAGCLAELAGALGADLVVHGSIGTLGSVIVVNLSLFDSARARAAGRDTFKVEHPEELPDRLRDSVRTLVDASARSRGRGGGGGGGVSPLVVAGGATAAVGVLGAAGATAAALAMNGTLADPDADADLKQLSLDLGVPAVFVALGAGALAVVGAGVAVVGLVASGAEE